MNQVAIVIVNWNGKEYLKECLASIYKQRFKDFKIFFIDNNSSDGSWKILDNYKSVILIRNSRNFGFAKGNNIGIKKALSDGYEYVVLVNNDTIADANWLGTLVKRMDKDAKIGACQSKILLHDSGLINTTGNVLHYLGFSYCGDYNKSDSYNVSKEITVASGASLILRSETLKKVGLFDEAFFMYHEDVDLSWRIREQGYTIWFEPLSKIFHKYSFSRNKMKFFYAEKNRIIFILKNFQTKTLLILLPPFIITELLMIVYSLLGGWLGLKIRSYKEIITSRKDIKIKRDKIQKERSVNDKKLKELFSNTLSFEEVSTPLFIPLNLFYRLYWFFFHAFI